MSKYCFFENFFLVCVWYRGGGEGFKGCMVLLVILYNNYRVYNLGEIVFFFSFFVFIKIW